MEQIQWRPPALDAVLSEAEALEKFVLVDFFSPT
jgi:hypothetical protein